MVVVSHDRELLDLVDQIADLRDGEVPWYGGNFTAYEEALAVEQEAAERMVRVAEADVQRQKRELADAHVKLARRKRYGQKMWDNKREPKIVMGARKRAAQESAGKHRIMHTEKLAEAKERLDEAVEAVRDDDEIRIELPYTAGAVRAGACCALSELTLRYGARVTGEFEVRGPERIALVGRNGAGKTTLLRTIAGELAPVAGEAVAQVPLRFLPQRLDVLDDGLSVVENVARFAPDATNNRIRARLARFLFRGARADQPAGTLSGGERFRATLAALLLAEPAPQLLMLDEPTNNLDLASVRQLTDGAGVVRGSADRGQPRRAVPGVDRHHPLAAAGRRAAGHHRGRGTGGWLPAVSVRAVRGARPAASRVRHAAPTAAWGFHRAARRAMMGADTPGRPGDPPVPSRKALIRRPSPRLAEGLVTHIERTTVDAALALEQWEAYAETLRDARLGDRRDGPGRRLPGRRLRRGHGGRVPQCRPDRPPGGRVPPAGDAAVEETLARLGCSVNWVWEPGTLDGGDVLKIGDTIYVGRGGRTNAAGVQQLRAAFEPLGARVVAVPVSKVLHLKSAVTALPDATVIGYPPLVDTPSVFPRLLPVPEESGCACGAARRRKAADGGERAEVGGAVHGPRLRAGARWTSASSRSSKAA